MISLTGASWISFTEYYSVRGSAEYRFWKVPLVAKRCWLARQVDRRCVWKGTGQTTPLGVKPQISRAGNSNLYQFEAKEHGGHHGSLETR